MNKMRATQARWVSERDVDGGSFRFLEVLGGHPLSTPVNVRVSEALYRSYPDMPQRIVRFLKGRTVHLRDVTSFLEPYETLSLRAVRVR